MPTNRKSKGYNKCKGSGKVQMLTWLPDTEEDYPGAVICLTCSHGVLIRKGTAHKAISESGFEGMAGTVRTHYLNKNNNLLSQ